MLVHGNKEPASASPPDCSPYWSRYSYSGESDTSVFSRTWHANLGSVPFACFILWQVQSSGMTRPSLVTVRVAQTVADVGGLWQ